METEPIIHSPVSNNFASAEHGPSVDMSSDKHSPSPMDTEPSKNTPSPTGSEPNKHSPTPAGSELSISIASPADKEVTAFSPLPRGNGPSLLHESSGNTSSDNSFLDSSPELSPQPKVKQALPEPIVDTKPLNSMKLSPLPELDSVQESRLSHEKKEVVSAKPVSLEESFAMEDDTHSKESLPEIKKDKASNGNSFQPHSPSLPPVKTKPASRVRSVTFQFNKASRQTPSPLFIRLPGGQP